MTALRSFAAGDFPFSRAVWLLPALALFLLGCSPPPPPNSNDDDSEPLVDTGLGVLLELGDQVDCAQPEPRSNTLRMEDRTEVSGIAFTASTPEVTPELAASQNVEMGGGLAVADFDGDGHLDAMFADWSRPLRLFFGNGEGGFSQADPLDYGLEAEGAWAVGLSAADADGDGDVDVLLLARERDHFFRNDGTGQFTPDCAGTGLCGEPARSASAGWADFDQDGDLDLAVAVYSQPQQARSEALRTGRDRLWVQRSGVFENLIGDLYPKEEDGFGYVAGWFDADGDGWLDLYVVNDTLGLDFADNLFLHNTAGSEAGPGLERAPERGLDTAVLAMGLALGDMDQDGDLDVHVTNAGPTFLARNDGDYGFVDVSLAVAEHSTSGNRDISWSTEFADLGNDGALELWTAYGDIPETEGFGPNGTLNPPEQRDGLWAWDREAGSYRDIADLVGIDDPRSVRAGVFADFDRNGFLDLLSSSLYDGSRLFLSPCNDNSWLRIRLHLPESGNRDAIGARVTASAASGERYVRELSVGSTGALSSGPAELHFGLGQNDEVDLEIRWPDGGFSTLPAVPTRRAVTITRVEEP